jgi:hypothetical protein
MTMKPAIAAKTVIGSVMTDLRPMTILRGSGRMNDRRLRGNHCADAHAGIQWVVHKEFGLPAGGGELRVSLPLW